MQLISRGFKWNFNFLIVSNREGETDQKNNGWLKNWPIDIRIPMRSDFRVPISNRSENHVFIASIVKNKFGIGQNKTDFRKQAKETSLSRIDFSLNWIKFRLIKKGMWDDNNLFKCLGNNFFIPWCTSPDVGKFILCAQINCISFIFCIKSCDRNCFKKISFQN